MKSCSSPSPCEYRHLSTCIYGCSFEGYCDFQLPRDSRPWNPPNLSPINYGCGGTSIEFCICAGQESNAGKCLTCGKLKQPKTFNGA